MSLRPHTAIAAAVALVGLVRCDSDVGPAPVVLALSPDRVSNEAPREIRVEGENFALRIRGRFDAPNSSTLRGEYLVTLTPREPGRAAMQLPATRHSSQLLSFTVPTGFHAGVYDVVVIDPFERSTSPARQLEIIAAPCAFAGACLGDGGFDAGTDSGFDAGTDGGFDAGTDGGSDAGTDGGFDAGTDGGFDGGFDGGIDGGGIDGGGIDGGGIDGGGIDGGTDGGPDSGTPDAGNTPPQPCFAVSPRSAPVGTVFSFDARCSSDPDQPSSTLTVRFDFAGQGAYTPYGQNDRAYTFSYPDAGTHLATVQVLDDTGLYGLAALNVHVAEPAAALLVTTGIDEENPGATPADAGGTGLSLREAINFAIANPVPPRSIRFDGGIVTLATQAMPVLPDNLVIAGDGNTLDFGGASAGANSGCLRTSTGNRVLGLRISNCSTNLIRVDGDGAQISDCVLFRGPQGGTSGLFVGGNGLDFSNNVVSGFSASAVFLSGAGARLTRNRFHGNGTAIGLNASADGALISRNFFYDNAVDGISATGASIPPHQVWLNTFHRNLSSAVRTNATGPQIDLRDNLFTENGGFAVNGAAGAFSARTPNGFFLNPSGRFSGGDPATGAIDGDPLYRNPDAGDFRLRPGSPMRDRGVDLGQDLNGPEVGNFVGSAPDLGADEAP